MEERRLAVAGAASAVKWYVIGIVGMALVTIAAVVLLAIYVPDNPTIIATVIGVTSPIILTLLGFGQRAMAVAVDGKLSLLMQASEDKARLEGKLEGLEQNPKTNI